MDSSMNMTDDTYFLSRCLDWFDRLQWNVAFVASGSC